MRKFITLLIINTFLFILCVSNVNAECTYTEKANLNKLAANVKVDYEIDKKTTKLSELGIPSEDPEAVSIEYILNLNFTNLSKELYIVGREEKTDETITKTYNDLVNGISTVSYNDLSFVRKFTFKVYGSSESACANEILKTFYITLPMHNPYYRYCSEDNDYYLCKEFVTSEVTEEQFFEKYNSYNEKNDKSEKTEENKESNKWYDVVIEFISKNIIYVILVIILTGASYGIYRYKKTKKQRELGL